METAKFSMQEVRDFVKTLPRGWKSQVAKTTSEKVLFYRMLKKESVAQLSTGEYEIMERLQDFIVRFKKDNAKKEKEILEAIRK